MLFWWFTILKHNDEIIVLDYKKYDYSTTIEQIVADYQLDLSIDVVQHFLSEGIPRSSGTIRTYMYHTNIPEDIFKNRLLLLQNGDGVFKEKIDRFWKVDGGYKAETWLQRLD